MGYYQAERTQSIPLGSFAPDLDPLTPGIVLGLTGAVPTTKGFRAIPTAVQVVGALPGPCIGSTYATYSNGTTRIVAGTATHLYSASGPGWVEVDNAQTYAATSRWRFDQFGDDLIAVAAGVAPQVANGAAGQFSALAGSPPNGATNIISLGSVVMMSKADQWYSSAVGTDNSWVPSLQTLAATGPLNDFPGPITALAQVYRSVIVWKNSGMWLGTFVGAPSTWSFQPISDYVGTWGQENVIPLSDGVAFIGTDDFYLCNGSAPVRIPNHLRRWFFDTVDISRMSEIFGWHDEQNSVLWWHFPDASSPAGILNNYVTYNQRSQRWGQGLMSVTFIPYPMNSTVTNPLIASYFDTSNILQSWSGPTGAMQLLTHFVGEGATLTQLLRIRGRVFSLGASPSIPAGPNPLSFTCTPRHTPQIGVGEIMSQPAILGADGWFNCRQTDRYHRILLGIQGDVELSTIDWQLRAAGRR